MALKKLVTDLTNDINTSDVSGLVAYPNHNTPSTAGGFNYGESTSIFDNKVFNQRSLFAGYLPITSQENPEPLIPQLLPGVNLLPQESILFLDDAPDGFIRGGENNAVKRATLDKIRIDKFYLTGEGISFLTNQEALQKSNPVIQEAGGATAGNFIESMLNSMVGIDSPASNSNRTFNKNNLIKQIEEGGYTGTYFNRAGANPTKQADDQTKYEASHKPGRKFDANQMGSFGTLSGLQSGNRLVSLGKKLSVGTGMSWNLAGGSLMEQSLGFDFGDMLDTWTNIQNSFNDFISNPLEVLSNNTSDNIGFNPGENIIYQYSGGPGSTYGVGDTILYRYERTGGDYDHQGHPISFTSYYQNQQVTPAVGSGPSGMENLFTNTINETFFGGNNILGPDSIFTGEGGFFCGLANQIFGENTMNFLGNVFGGNSSFGDPLPSLGESVDRGSYKVGGVNTLWTIAKIQSNNTLITQIPNVITGFPIHGFLPHKYKSNPKNEGGFETTNKPDDIASRIEDGNDDELNYVQVGKVINPNPYLQLATNKPYYNPNQSQITKEGRKRLGESGDTDVTDSYNGKHYYSSRVSEAKHMPGRIGIGDPGHMSTANSRSLEDYTSDDFKTNTIDKINMLDIHTVTDATFTDDIYNDLIPLRFEAMDNETPSETNVMVFRAFLDGYSDNFNSSWNSFKYNGRAEEFYTYNSFKRSVSFQFKVGAQTRHELKPIYRKLNYLATTLAPDYTSQGRLRGSFIRVTVGDLLTRVPGFLTQLSLKWSKNYPFEIALDSTKDNDVLVLPHILDVSCAFTPIHDFIPKKSVTNSSFFAKTGTGRTANFYDDEEAGSIALAKTRAGIT